MRIAKTVAAVLVLCVAMVGAVRTTQDEQPGELEAPRRRPRLVGYFAVILAGAALFGWLLQRLVPALMRLGGDAFEWTIFLGTLLGGISMVAGLAAAIVRRASRRTVVLQLVQVLGVWAVCIGTLMQIRG